MSGLILMIRLSNQTHLKDAYAIINFINSWRIWTTKRHGQSTQKSGTSKVALSFYPTSYMFSLI